MKNTMAIKVKSGIKGCGLAGTNHNVRGLKVKAGIKSGGLAGTNHSRRLIRSR